MQHLKKIFLSVIYKIILTHVQKLGNLTGDHMSTILLIILILLLVGAFPSWPYSTGWGYGPSGLLGVVLLILIILMLLGRI